MPSYCWRRKTNDSMTGGCMPRNRSAPKMKKTKTSRKIGYVVAKQRGPKSDSPTLALVPYLHIAYLWCRVVGNKHPVIRGTRGSRPVHYGLYIKMSYNFQL